MPLLHNLGVAHACTLLGSVAAALGSVQFLFFSEHTSTRFFVDYPLIAKTALQSLGLSFAACPSLPARVERDSFLQCGLFVSHPNPQ